LLPEGTLKKVAQAFTESPDWDALFGDVVYVDGMSREIFRREEACYDYDVLRFGNVCYVISPTLFVKKTFMTGWVLINTRSFSMLRSGVYSPARAKLAAASGTIPQLLETTECMSTDSRADRRVSRNMRRES